MKPKILETGQLLKFKTGAVAKPYTDTYFFYSK